jgi:cyanophycinase
MMKQRCLLVVCFCLMLVCGNAISAEDNSWIDPSTGWKTLGPPKGTLFIYGGQITDQFYTHFLQLVGDMDALIVVIPTAGNEDAYGPDFKHMVSLKRLGAKNLQLLHTRDRAVANSEAFVEPLRQARAVWISGGQQRRLAEAYVHTRTHREIFNLLERDGIVGGTSAGASIQGSFLYGGGSKQPEGFSLIRNSAIGQHYFRRKRHTSLQKRLQKQPDLLGIGIDELTAIIVRGDRFRVVGKSKVGMFDAKRLDWQQKPYICLFAGDSYDMRQRKAFQRKTSNSADSWSEAGKPWSNPQERWKTLRPAKGKLLSGSVADATLLKRFLVLAGGNNAPIVVVPTAASYADDMGERTCAALRALGASNVTMLHTIDRNDANSNSFVAPLRKAKGVWFCDGEPWWLAEAYLHTLVHHELFQLLERGGVICGEGSSANMMSSQLQQAGSKWTTGFGFLREASVDNGVMENKR